MDVQKRGWAWSDLHPCPTRSWSADLWPHVESGKLKLPIDRTFPLDKAAEALAHMRANAHFGKIALVV
jgi:NADPH2:quinone reductase